ncbi:MAG TPA: DnaJ domain-containing protein, partial [Flavipsychrobacter sp.]|nr:DnaJ domain-containing protein [Flavipsychrobacter sp.]
MSATALKDYYKILDIHPAATVEEVKKAYRKMAFKYHPDTGIQDAFAESYFHEVQEAYIVLSDESRRRQYDNDRWLAGMTDRAREHKAVSPDWVLKESIKLYNHITTVDVYRMNHRSLYEYLLQLLNDRHMSILTSSDEPSVNEGIVNMVLQSTKGLKYTYMRPVADRLGRLAADIPELQQKLDAMLKARRREAQWEKRMP